MNTTQTLSWLLCLLLAFVAAIMAARANYQAALTKQQFELVQQEAADQEELLGQIRDVLQQIEQHMASPAPARPAVTPDAQTNAAYEAAEQPSG